jgi:hypothetical protein
LTVLRLGIKKRNIHGICHHRDKDYPSSTFFSNNLGKDKIYSKYNPLVEVAGSTNKHKSLIFYFALLLIIMAFILGYYMVEFSDAQIIPLPPPLPSTDSKTDRIQNQAGTNDIIPPAVQFLTTELTRGKNVFKVNITDDSDIGLREIGYVHAGQITTQTLVFEGNDVYKGLVNVDPPSAVIVVNVDDIYGNKASFAKSLPVKEPPDIFSRLFDMLVKK